MADEISHLVGSAFLSGASIGRGVMSSRPAPGYERPRMAHKVARMPIRLDGDRVPSNTVQRFEGKPLYYILTPNSDELAVFTDKHLALGFAGQLEDEEKKPSAPAERGEGVFRSAVPGVRFYGYVELFQHINYGGGRWTFWADWGDIPDFRRVYPTFWWFTNINDLISSVDTYITFDGPGNAWTVLYQDINYQGSQLWIPYGPNSTGLVPDLVMLGWNDIASSMSYQTLGSQTPSS